MKEIRIIIAGGRDFKDYSLLKTYVNEYISNLEDRNSELGIENIRDNIKIISGTARGVDRLGEQFAAEFDYDIVRFPANWDKYGKSAGYIRNTEMAQYAVDDGSYGVLIAFWDGESRGTKHMIDTAKRYGLSVFVQRYN